MGPSRAHGPAEANGLPEAHGPPHGPPKVHGPWGHCNPQPPLSVALIVTHLQQNRSHDAVMEAGPIVKSKLA